MVVCVHFFQQRMEETLSKFQASNNICSKGVHYISLSLSLPLSPLSLSLPPWIPPTLQTDLGSISSEIQNLQDQSQSMNVKLRNRQVSRHQILIPSPLTSSPSPSPSPPPRLFGVS